MKSVQYRESIATHQLGCKQYLVRLRASHRRTLGLSIRAVISILMGLSVPVYAAECFDAAPGAAQWQNSGFAAQTGVFSFTVAATPQYPNSDLLVALSDGAKTNWTGLAAITRFNTANTIDVRDGGVYRADRTMTYTAGETRNLRFDVDVPNHLYSVYHNTPYNVSWWPLAYNYLFRTEQQGVFSLNNFVAEAEVGALRACVLDVHPWVRATPGIQQWQNRSLVPTETGRGLHILQWRVRPSAASSDALLALANGPQTQWSGLGAIVRFNSSNTIDVRNGDVYMADNVLPYSPNQTYDVRMHVHMPLDGRPGDYSVWVNGVQIANQYAFRTEQQGVTQFTHWVLEAEAGGISADLYARDLE